MDTDYNLNVCFIMILSKQVVFIIFYATLFTVHTSYILFCGSLFIFLSHDYFSQHSFPLDSSREQRLYGLRSYWQHLPKLCGLLVASCDMICWFELWSNITSSCMLCTSLDSYWNTVCCYSLLFSLKSFKSLWFVVVYCGWEACYLKWWCLGCFICRSGSWLLPWDGSRNCSCTNC